MLLYLDNKNYFVFVPIQYELFKISWSYQWSDTKKIRGNLLKINHTFPENSHGANEVWVCIFWFVFPTLCSIYYISAACNKGHIQM